MLMQKQALNIICVFSPVSVFQAHESSVRAMKWSHNDQWMITADHAGFIKYWQSNMNNVKMYQGHKEPIRSLRWDFAPSAGSLQLGSKIKLSSCNGVTQYTAEASYNIAQTAVKLISLIVGNMQKYIYLMEYVLLFTGDDGHFVSSACACFILGLLYKRKKCNSLMCKLQKYLYLTKYALLFHQLEGCSFPMSFIWFIMGMMYRRKETALICKLQKYLCLTKYALLFHQSERCSFPVSHIWFIMGTMYRRKKTALVCKLQKYLYLTKYALLFL